MSRTLSQNAARAVFPPETSKVFLTLLDLDFTDASLGHLYVCNNWETVDVGGTDYLGYPFEVALPKDSDEELPQARIRIDNVSHSTFDSGTKGLIQYVRSMTTPIPVTLSVVLADSPTTVEAGPYSLYLREVRYDVEVIEGTLAYEPIWDEGFPFHTMSPYTFPGLFNLPTSALARAAAPEEGVTGGPAEKPTTPRGS